MANNFKLRNGGGKIDSYGAFQRQGLISPTQRVEGEGDEIKKSTKSSKDPETGLITVTTSESSSGGDVTPEAREWIKNNPDAYKKALEEKREKESMKSMTQVPTKPAIKIETEANPRDIKKVNQPPISPEPEKKKVKRSTSNSKKRKPTKYRKRERKAEFCTRFSNKC